MTKITQLRETYEVRVTRSDRPFANNRDHWVLFSQQPSKREAQAALRRALTGGPDSWKHARIVHEITYSDQ